MALTLQGVEVESPSSNRTQVYMATHGGELRLPFMKRSFISFSYGGKWIEDFGLIAVAKGDGIERGGYAAFNDITTDSDVLDGQMYWSTHFKANELEFDLATDAIDQRELETFLNWFQPGRPKELILAEHPNRAILARVSEPPNLSLSVFEKPITLQFGSSSQWSYTTSTTVYRGHISLKLIMDDPFWYAKNNLLGVRHEGLGISYFADEFIDANGNTVNILSAAGKDALKIVYEDGVPLGSMITCDMLLGNGIVAKTEQQYYHYPTNIAEYSTGTTYQGTSISPFRFCLAPNEPISSTGIGAIIAPDTGTTYNSNLSLGDTLWIGVDEEFNEGKPFYYKIVNENGGNMVIPSSTAYGRIAGAVVSDTGASIWPYDTPLYFYYSGTAPAPLKITFTLMPQFSGEYLVEPKNRYAHTGDVYYNTITVVGDGEDETDNLVFRVTAPFLFTSYNHILDLFVAERNTSSWVDFEKTLRAAVIHPYVRWCALQMITAFIASSSKNLSDRSFSEFAYNLKSKVFYKSTFSATFSFDSRSGEASVVYKGVNPGYSASKFLLLKGGVEPSASLSEDAGDMLQSNRLYVTDRNYFNTINQVDHFYNDPDRRHYSHYIKHNFSQTLTNVVLDYQNLYL